jgi:hypothetical protein
MKKMLLMLMVLASAAVASDWKSYENSYGGFEIVAQLRP